MECIWLKMSPSFIKGITVINQLDDTRFEQFLRRIVAKIKVQVAEIFSIEEIQKLTNIFNVDEESLILAIKTLIYMFKTLLKYIFMPMDLKTDLKSLGLSNDKAEHIIKLWSSHTRSTLDDLDKGSIEKTSDTIDFTWSLNAELSSDYCKKSKVPKAYISLTKDKERTDLEMTHSVLYSMFLQFEGIQHELDNMGI